MAKPVTAYSVDGRRICMAAHIPNTAFRDKAAAQEHAKSKRRLMKHRKQELEELGRMNRLEYQAAYPEIEDAEPPEPGVIVPNFGQELKVVHGAVVDAGPAAAGGAPDAFKGLDELDEIALRMGEEYYERNRKDRQGGGQ